MFTLLDRVGIAIVARRELAPFAAAFVIAELFYKFKSFSLECLAFLMTWYLLSYIQSMFMEQR